MTPHRRAARLVASLRRRGVSELFAYSGADSARVFARAPSAREERSIGENVCGALPFDRNDAPDLFEPDFAARLGPNDDTALRHGEHIPSGLDGIFDETRETVSAIDYDLAPERDLALFEGACAWVGDSARRLTVARTLPLPDVDLAATFAQYAPTDRARAFLRLGAREFVGLSPELLAVGNRNEFRSFKLSGTAPPGDDDMALDARLVREHASSIASAADALSPLGPVERGPRRVVTLPSLRHFETELLCTPRRDVSLRDCIDAVRPYGASPVAEGLAQRARLEGASRGLYYGLVGFCEPDGFSFSQTLRAVFRERGRCFTRVGAAVTSRSTPALELAETRLKLASIRFVLA